MKLKGAGFLPLFAILLFFHSAWCDKLVEVTAPIIKIRVLPSATSESKGLVRKGQRLVVDGENGQWFQVRLYNQETAWIPKEAVIVLEDTGPASAPAAAATTATTAGIATAPAPDSKAQENIAVPRFQATLASAAVAKQRAQAAKRTAVAPETSKIAVAPLPQPAAHQTAATVPVAAAAPVAVEQPSPQYPARVPVHAAMPKKAYIAIRKSSTWQSQFSNISETESGKELLFYQVSINDAPVFSASDPSSVILTKVKKGDFFPLVDTAGPWCKIALQDTAGWIEGEKGSIVSAPTMGFFEEHLLQIIIAGAVVVLVLAIVLIIVFRRSARDKERKTGLFHTLILAKSPPQIQCVVSNKAMSLEEYLIAIGFSVKTVHVLAGAQKAITKQPPDVVFIDWEISNDIPGTIEILFTGYDEKKLPCAIFFNVPDPSDVPMVPVMLRAYYLGRSFTDHDISKLVTPTMLSRTAQKTVSAAALEGDIAEGNLPEIMQFIEIGKKTGCLLVEHDSPLGMIYFGQGRIIHAAAADNITGRDAIGFLLKLKVGKFKFLLNKEPKTSDLNLSTLEVLMEWSKAEDEAHRG
jgi:hypothetical protein